MILVLNIRQQTHLFELHLDMDIQLQIRPAHDLDHVLEGLRKCTGCGAIIRLIANLLGSLLDLVLFELLNDIMWIRINGMADYGIGILLFDLFF